MLYGQLVGMVASPITGLARGLNGLIGGLAIALGQLQQKKESGEVPAGEAPAAAAEPRHAAEPRRAGRLRPRPRPADARPRAAPEAERRDTPRPSDDRLTTENDHEE